MSTRIILELHINGKDNDLIVELLSILSKVKYMVSGIDDAAATTESM